MSNPTKQQVLDAAATSPEAKKALEKLFPDFFEDEVYFNLKNLRLNANLGNNIFPIEKALEAGFNTKGFIAIRKFGPFKDKAFFLTRNCNWSIETDSEGCTVLIPRKKIK